MKSFVAALLGFCTVAMVMLYTATGPTLQAKVAPAKDYKVLEPITQDSLTIFPVVAAITHSTREFITLDEGLRSGEVIVSEAGSTELIRPRRRDGVRPGYGPEVNRLVLINNSDRPLILLAGEIVTGGKQDRVVAKDRIVPAKSDPIDLGVFCVEPGRWTGVSSNFNAGASVMAQPSLRAKAMADKDQGEVWNQTRQAQESLSARVIGNGSAPKPSGSYAGTMASPQIMQQVDEVAKPLARSYETLIKRLRAQNAVGVVVAVNGEIVWADLFADTSLLEKYWPKLARSYAAESLTSRAKHGQANSAAAERFLNTMEGTHQTIESEPGVYRHTEISGDGFRLFELTSLLPGTGFDLHLSKMAESVAPGSGPRDMSDPYPRRDP